MYLQCQGYRRLPSPERGITSDEYPLQPKVVHHSSLKDLPRKPPKCASHSRAIVSCLRYHTSLNTIAHLHVPVQVDSRHISMAFATRLFQSIIMSIETQCPYMAISDFPQQLSVYPLSGKGAERVISDGPRARRN